MEKIKLLIVEDEPLVARMYQKALSYDNFEVVSAKGGKEGLEMAKKEKPDFILLDIMMPEMNGIQVLEKLKDDTETADVPVVMLTNLSGRHDEELAKDKGAEEFWVKVDTDIKKMGDKIRQIIEESKKQKSGTSETDPAKEE